MPDISMCDNNACPVRNDCYRFRAIPNEYRQTYADFQLDRRACDAFYPIVGLDNLRPIEGTE